MLDLLGVTDAANYKEDYNVYYTTNAEEHQYLDKYLSASVIGTNSLSSICLLYTSIATSSASLRSAPSPQGEGFDSLCKLPVCHPERSEGS